MRRSSEMASNSCSHAVDQDVLRLEEGHNIGDVAAVIFVNTALEEATEVSVANEDN